MGWDGTTFRTWILKITKTPFSLPTFIKKVLMISLRIHREGENTRIEKQKEKLQSQLDKYRRNNTPDTM